MIQRLEAQGNKEGKDKWDDGSDHDDVTKIYVRADPEGIHYIRFDYIKNGQPKYGAFHHYQSRGLTQTFELNHLKNEQLESVDGYYDPNSKAILGLQFKTNLRISELIGYVKNGSKFSLAVEGKKIIGFHGSSDSRLNSLGAYFSKIAPAVSIAKGGKGGTEWDDGADHEGITKIYVRGDCRGIQYIRFDYVKDGKQIYGSIHGGTGKGYTQTFEIDHFNKEYLVSVDGYYNNSGVIQGLQFETNMKTSEFMGEDEGRKFRLANNGKKIIGFYGYAENNLNSLGAYFTTSTTHFTKLECQGLQAYEYWDDGTCEGIRKVYVQYSNSSTAGVQYISGIRFHYDNGGKVERYQHGSMNGQETEFEIDYPNEFITSMEGSLATSGASKWVESLSFKTSKGRTSPTFGSTTGSKFVLGSKGCALVGFHGWCSYAAIFGLGAYFLPQPPRSEAGNVESPTSDDGELSWDDGVFDGIRNIYIGHNEMGVALVKFLYVKDNQTMVGDDHGTKRLLGVDEFKLNYPSEYLISVECGYDDVDADRESQVIRMLRFKTNMRTSQVFGLQKTVSFTLKMDGHKIVGFQGKFSNMLNEIGIYVKPIAE